MDILDLVGAFVRWILGGRKHPFNDYFMDGWLLNTFIGFMVIVIMILIMLFYVNYVVLDK